MLTLEDLVGEMKKLANPKKAKDLSRFFKTGKGEYGEGDIFLGLVVPQQRQLSKKYQDLSLKDLQILLSSKIHEQRLVALMILVLKSAKAKEKEQKEIVNFYLKNTKRINNWDLVDLSCHHILGKYFFNKDRKIFYKLARSKNLWEKRISVISTFDFIRNNQFEDSLKIAEILLHDKHDLIHKAVGWMLREIGKRDQKVEEEFLKKHYQTMPRTMLHYAIEKFPEPKRQFYLKKNL
jgi:3-methyladenine DNA glycosylase AlkD